MGTADARVRNRRDRFVQGLDIVRIETGNMRPESGGSGGVSVSWGIGSVPLTQTPGSPGRAFGLPENNSLNAARRSRALASGVGMF